MRLFDADALLERIKRFKYYFGRPPHAEELMYGIENSPTVDAVPVVRCKDCRLGEKNKGAYVREKTWCIRQETYHNDDWFCADGERRDDNAAD